MPSLFEVTAGSLVGPTSGGTVTQATNKGTAVTLSTESGQITLNGAALADAAEVSFTVTNSRISAQTLRFLHRRRLRLLCPVTTNNLD